MTRTTRITLVTLQTLIAASWLNAVGCSSSNDPATNPGTGGTSATGGSSGAGTGGTAPTTGGSAGTGTGTGGTGTGGSGTGGSGTGGTAGTESGGSAGTAGSGGTAATDGGGAAMYNPKCANNAAGVTIAKGVACTAADPQLCWKTCGPSSTGFKSETCTAGLYAEEPGGPPCHFPDGDYACYKIPATVDATCPATPPMASTPCTVAACTPCNAGGSYLDSASMTKTGYCVCPPAGAAGTRNWSCASTTAWPCPSGQGC